MYETKPIMTPSSPSPMEKPKSMHMQIIVLGGIVVTAGIIFFATQSAILPDNVPVISTSPISQERSSPDALDNVIYGQIQATTQGSSLADIDEDIQSTNTQNLDQEFEALVREQQAL